MGSLCMVFCLGPRERKEKMLPCFYFLTVSIHRIATVIISIYWNKCTENKQCRLFFKLWIFRASEGRSRLFPVKVRCRPSFAVTKGFTRFTNHDSMEVRVKPVRRVLRLLEPHSWRRSHNIRYENNILITFAVFGMYSSFLDTQNPSHHHPRRFWFQRRRVAWKRDCKFSNQ